MERLVRGHKKFRSDYFESEEAFFRQLAEASHQPCHSFVIACSDSRVVPELVTSARPGELFVVRNVANIVPPRAAVHVSTGAAVEYALGHLPELGHVVVWGHYGCGGVKALLDGTEKLEAEPKLRQWVSLAEEARQRLEQEASLGADVGERWRRLVELNVILQMENLLSYPVVAEAAEAGRVKLHGWVYDLESARLKAYHPDKGFQWLE
jgi:carbonic anhydrase